MERTTGSGNLLRAAAIGSHRSIRRLLELREDVNAMAAQEHTPLFLAVEHNHPVAVYTLLRAGADALRRNRQGFNALHIAAQRGDPESLVVLLHHEPDSINVPAEDGRTPLHLAAAKDHVLCVQILLICGCDVTIADDYGCTAADYAATHKNPGSTVGRRLFPLFDRRFTDVELLLMTRTHQHMDGGRAAQLFETCREGGSLHIAAVRGDLALARKLLAEGADVWIVVPGGLSSLISVCVAANRGWAQEHGSAPCCTQRPLLGCG
jgi:ankyrin repeat protein